MKWNYVTKKNFFDSIQNGVWKTFIDCVLGAGFDIRTKKSNGYTVLSFAAEYGDRQIVEYLVQKGADGNVTNCDGTKPLHIAAKHSHKNVVELFVNLGVFVNSRDNNNRTPLHCASETFHRQYANPRTWNGRDYIRNSYNNTMASITCTASEKHMELVYFLLVNGADIDACDNKGDVPILLAAKYSCVHVVKMLILFNATLECCDKQKWTLLHYASLNGWLNVVQPLVDKGCDVNAKTRSGDTPIMFVLRNPRRDIFDLFVKSGANLKCCDSGRRTVLQHACRNGWLDVVQSLVESGFDVNAEGNGGDTPLLIAARYSHKDIVDMLLKQGANLKCCNWKKWTLLHYSCGGGWLDLVKFLMEAGVDINAQTHDRETPLFVAAKFSHFDIFDHLIESGADVNTKIHVLSYYARISEGYDRHDESEARSLLHHACSKGWLKVVLGLIKKGIDINEKDVEGDTALHLALRGNNLEIVKHLLHAGADCHIENDNYESVLQCLLENDLANAETIRLFIENGSCIQYHDYNALSSSMFFKEDILQDAKLCTQAIINKFNNVDLVEVYEEPVAVEYLPPIERMKMRSNGNMAHCIEQSVRHEIETNGYCNLVEVRPIVLSLIAVRSFMNNY